MGSGLPDFQNQRETWAQTSTSAFQHTHTYTHTHSQTNLNLSLSFCSLLPILQQTLSSLRSLSIQPQPYPTHFPSQTHLTLKGTVQPKIEILSSFTHPSYPSKPVWLTFFHGKQKENFFFPMQLQLIEVKQGWSTSGGGIGLFYYIMSFVLLQLISSVTTKSLWLFLLIKIV